MSLSFFSGLSGLVLPSNLPPHTVSRASAARMGCIEEFSISREIKSVRIFDGAYDTNICDEVTAAAQACIDVRPLWSKGYYRRAAACLAMEGARDEAMSCLQHALELCTDDADRRFIGLALEKASAVPRSPRSTRPWQSGSAAAGT